jgi:DNA-binding response OmpR family regulator
MMSTAVLVIEDEPKLAHNIQAYLARRGFDVHQSGNGAEGVDHFERFRPDVVVLDYRLPDMDGLEVLERLKSLDAAVKVIMMSGVAGRRLAGMAKEAGVFSYMTKPLALSHLKELLDKATAH